MVEDKQLAEFLGIVELPSMSTLDRSTLEHLYSSAKILSDKFQMGRSPRLLNVIPSAALLKTKIEAMERFQKSRYMVWPKNAIRELTGEGTVKFHELRGATAAAHRAEYSDEDAIHVVAWLNDRATGYQHYSPEEVH